MTTIKPSLLAIYSIISLCLISCNSTNTKTSANATTPATTPQVENKPSVTAPIPAWRKAASHTLTRGAKDAIQSIIKQHTL